MKLRKTTNPFDYSNRNCDAEAFALTVLIVLVIICVICVG